MEAILGRASVSSDKPSRSRVRNEAKRLKSKPEKNQDSTMVTGAAWELETGSVESLRPPPPPSGKVTVCLCCRIGHNPLVVRVHWFDALASTEGLVYRKAPQTHCLTLVSTKCVTDPCVVKGDF